MQTQVIFGNDSKGSLAGHLLVATPLIQDGCFARSVVYMCAHNEGGAMGLIVNYTIDSIQMADVLAQLDIRGDAPSRDFPVHFGGPVEANRGFVVHSADYAPEDSLFSANGVAVTANISALQAIGRGQGPRKGMLALGYAGWSSGQLEQEIESGGWMVVPATPQLVFDTDNELKWNLAMGTLGIDVGHYSTDVGHA